MRMRHLSGCSRFGNYPLQVVSEVSSDWCDAHRPAIAARALAIEYPACPCLPRSALADRSEDSVGCSAIAAPRIAVIFASKACREGVLLHVTVALQTANDGHSHHRVIGDKPGWRGRISVLQPSLNHCRA